MLRRQKKSQGSQKHKWFDAQQQYGAKYASAEYPRRIVSTFRRKVELSEDTEIMPATKQELYKSLGWSGIDVPYIAFVRRKLLPKIDEVMLKQTGPMIKLPDELQTSFCYFMTPYCTVQVLQKKHATNNTYWNMFANMVGAGESYRSSAVTNLYQNQYLATKKLKKVETLNNVFGQIDHGFGVFEGPERYNFIKNSAANYFRKQEPKIYTVSKNFRKWARTRSIAPVLYVWSQYTTQVSPATGSISIQKMHQYQQSISRFLKSSYAPSFKDSMAYVLMLIPKDILMTKMNGTSVKMETPIIAAYSIDHLLPLTNIPEKRKDQQATRNQDKRKIAKARATTKSASVKTVVKKFSDPLIPVIVRVSKGTPYVPIFPVATDNGHHRETHELVLPQNHYLTIHDNAYAISTGGNLLLFGEYSPHRLL